ncbi:MAG: Gfo/Idh/MocA family oxidoreductase [Acidobacteriota bacterium]
MGFHLGIVGTGRIADLQLAPAVRAASNTVLWSVMSRDRDRATDFAKRHGAEAEHAAHDDLADMLADPSLDGVLLATPDALHAEQALQALQAGKHVLTEKPMTTDPEDGRKLVKAAADTGLCVAVAYHLRWHAGHREARQRVLDGALGELRHARAQWTWQAPDGENWRASPEVGRWWSLAGVGTHCLDLLRWFLLPSEGEVESQSSLLSTGVWDRPHDETAMVSLRFASGTTAQLLSSALFNSESVLEVHGSKGSLTCTGTLGPHGAGTVRLPDGVLEHEVKNPFVGEIEDFASAATESRAPEVPATEGLRNVEILDEAARAGGLSHYG